MNKKDIQQFIPKGVIADFFENGVIFETPREKIRETVNHLRHIKNLPLKLITATDDREEQGHFRIWYVFGIPEESAFLVLFTRLIDTEEFFSVTPLVHEAWSYERKIKTFFGLTPIGHPDSRALILHENWPTNVFPLRKDFDGKTRPKPAKGEYRFQKVEGEGIYEIPVGPIHAGIIEPGHFRFSVAGEEIILLEPRLGYTHKGSEKLFESLSLPDQVRLSEKISGDSSFSHSLAFCQALEQLSGIEIPARARYLRVIFAELERLANHFGDIGAIMLDTGFNFGGAHGARLREAMMRISERFAGSRFLRGVNMVGGVAKDIGAAEAADLTAELAKIRKDFSEIIAIAENSASLVNRLKGTGILSPEDAREHGVVGVAARALGIKTDTRLDYPYAAYGELPEMKIETEADGDVGARFSVRVKEVYASMKIINQALNELPKGELCSVGEKIKFKRNSLAVSAVEGWRGEILYFVATDKNGRVSRVAPRDPSFVNWPILGHAGLGNIVPDFPLINKSFNLSYTGNDL